MYALLLSAPEIDFPSFGSIGRFFWIFPSRFLPVTERERCNSNIDVTVFDRRYLLPVILVYSGKVLRIFVSNPFPFILFEPAARCKLYLSAIFVHAHANPCAALIILDDPSYLAVNPIDFINQLFTACIPWDFLNIIRYHINFAFQSFSVRLCSGNITMFAFPLYYLKLVSEKCGVFLSYIRNQCFLFR